MFTKKSFRHGAVIILLLIISFAVSANITPAYALETNTVLNETPDWQKMYEDICADMGIAVPEVLPGPGGSYGSGSSAVNLDFPYALLTPATKDRPDADSYVVMIMGDGFTAAADEQAKFNYYCQYYAKNLVKYKPFDEFADMIKIYRINVPSNESGVTRDKSPDGRNMPRTTDVTDPFYPGDTRNTFFGASVWNAGVHRSFNVNQILKATNIATGYCRTNSSRVATLFFNTEVYGGVSTMGLSYTGIHWSFMDVAVHEQGHTNGLVPDEYDAGGSYYNTALNNYRSFPNLVTGNWVNNADWQKWNPWWRLIGKGGVTIDPFVEATTNANPLTTNFFRPSRGCKMRFVGYNDYLDTYGVEEYPFCLVCQEKFRDRLSIMSKTPVLHFQPYNDDFYDNQPVKFDDKHFILRLPTVDSSLASGSWASYSKKVYGESMADGELTYTVKNASDIAVYTDISPGTPMTLAAGIYTVEASYDGAHGKIDKLRSVDNSFEVKQATIIKAVGNHATPWESVLNASADPDKLLALTRPWKKGLKSILPPIEFDFERSGSTSATRADFDITYTWHLRDFDGTTGAQIAGTGMGIEGSVAVAGPSSVGSYVLRIYSKGKAGTSVADYDMVNDFPFEIETPFYTADHFMPNSTAYFHEVPGNMWRQITIVGEGFTEAEQDKFEAIAQGFITKFLDTTPVNQITERFGFWIENTMSVDSGISKPGYNKNTYYGFALDGDGKFTKSPGRTDELSFEHIIRQEVWRRDTNMKTVAQWGATVVFVNDDTVQANYNWRHDPELNRSVHLTTIKDADYSRLIESVVTQFAHVLANKEPDWLDTYRWMEGPENSYAINGACVDDVLQRLTESSFSSTRPVIVSDASLRTYKMMDGEVYDLTDPDNLQPFNIADTLKAYIFGHEIRVNTVTADTFTYRYYTDNGHRVGTLLPDAPQEPGFYWAEADLPSGNKYFARTETDRYGFTYNEGQQTPGPAGTGTAGAARTRGFVRFEILAQDIEAPVPEITITSQPASVTVMEGSISGSLTVAATVTEDGIPAYQWYEGISAADTDGAAIADAVNASFAIPVSLVAGTYYYYCVISAQGAEPVTSDVATVTVDPEPEIPTVIVSFDANGGILSGADSKTVTVGEPYGDLPTPNRDDHTFDGWFSAASGGAKVMAADIVTNDENHTLFAQWIEDAVSIAEYSIVFHANAGTGFMATDTVEEGANYTIKANAFQRGGYSFSGWNTQADGQGTAYAAGAAIYSVKANIDLYAQWIEDAVSVAEYSIIFHANAGTGVMAADTVEEGANYTIKANAFQRGGYSISGWNTQADGQGAAYAAGATIYSIKANIDLYAQWIKDAVVGGGGGGGTSPAAKNASISPITITYDPQSAKDVTVTLNRNGHTFKALINGAVTLKEGADFSISGNTVTIKAGYLAGLGAGQHTLTFVMSSGKNPILDIIITISDSKTPLTDISTAFQPMTPLHAAGTMVAASKTNNALLLDGEKTVFPALKIGGYNWLKLRDFAMLLNDTSKQFSVSYDGKTNVVDIRTDGAYQPLGNELSDKLADTETAIASPQRLRINGEFIDAAAYNIKGFNYFRLRDLAIILDFAVMYDDASGQITLDFFHAYDGN